MEAGVNLTEVPYFEQADSRLHRLFAIDGKEIGEIESFELQVDTTVPHRLVELDFAEVEQRVLAHMSEKAQSVAEHAAAMTFYGTREITGTVTCTFVDSVAFHDFIEAGDRCQEQMVAFADAAVRVGLVAPKDCKIWRKKRKAILAKLRRKKARAARRAMGRKTF